MRQTLLPPALKLKAPQFPFRLYYEERRLLTGGQSTEVHNFEL